MPDDGMSEWEAQKAILRSNIEMRDAAKNAPPKDATPAPPAAPAAPKPEPKAAPLAAPEPPAPLRAAREMPRPQLTGTIQAPPELKLAPPPTTQATDPASVWGSVAMVAAGLGSLLTRGHLTTALNAAAGVVKGYRQGDQEAANSAFQTWKTSNENALKMANYEREMYNSLLSNTAAQERIGLEREGLSEREIHDRAIEAPAAEKRANMARILAVAKSNNDDAMVAAAMTGDPAAVARVVTDRARNMDKVKDATDAAVAHNLHIGAMKEETEKFTKEAGRPPSQVEQSQLWTKITKGKLSDEEINSLVDFYGSGKGVMSTYMARSAEGAAIINGIMKRYPDYNGFNILRRLATDKAFATGTAGNTLRSIEVADDHLETLMKTAAALKNGEVQRANAMMAGLATEFGRQEPVDFNTAKEIVGDEVVKAVTGAGGGTESDRANLKRNIVVGSSPEQFAGQEKTFRALLSGQIKGLYDQAKRGKGDVDEIFPRNTLSKFGLSVNDKGDLVGGGFSTEAPSVPAAAKYSNESLASARKAAIAHAKSKPADLGNVNANLKHLGLTPLTPEELGL